MLLVDQNLPLALAHSLKFAFPDTVHVREIGMEMKTDSEIWQYAREKNLIIISKDSDFYDRLTVKGFPPKLIWVRTGNVSTSFLIMLFQNLQEKIKQFVQENKAGFLEIF